MMNNPRDFLPEKYRHYLVNDDLKTSFIFPKKKIKNLANVFIVFFLAIGLFVSFLLSKQTQDNRQQAFESEPYSTITTSPTPTTASTPIATSTPTTNPTLIPTSTLTPTPATVSTSTTNRPTTKSSCNGQGNWLNDTCYLYWEVLPGGTYVVVPPNTINNYKYPTFQSLKLVESYLAAETTKKTPKPDVQKIEKSVSASPTPIVSTTAKYANDIFFNQLDNRWKNIYIEENIKFGNVGCGVTSVANLTGVSPDKVLGLYDIGNTNGITANGTSLKANAEALKKLGYETRTGVNGNGVLEDEIRQANLNNNYSDLIDNLKKYQKEGNWQIMLNGNFGNLGGGGHWVVVKDIDVANAKITVIDPNGGALKEYFFDNAGSFGKNDEAISPKRLLLARKD